MKMRQWVLLLGMFGLLTACGGGGGTGVPGGEGTVDMYLTDVADTQVEAVWATITQISLRSASGDWLDLLPAGENLEVNLLDLQSVRMLVGSLNVPPGTYDAVRVQFGAIRVVENGQMQQVDLVTDKVELPIGLVVEPNGHFEVTVDINVREALEKLAGNWVFDPTKPSVGRVDVKETPPADANVAPNPNVPGEREVLVKGEVVEVYPSIQAFLMEVAAADLPAKLREVNWLVLVSASTEFRPPGTGFGDLRPGRKVAVKGVAVRKNGRRALFASSVLLKVPEVPGTARGIIREILPYEDGDTVGLVRLGDPYGWWLEPEPEDGPVMEHVWVAVRTTTQLQDETGNPLSFQDLRVGMKAVAKGTWGNGVPKHTKVLQAEKMVVSDVRIPVRLTGYIHEVDEENQRLLVVTDPSVEPWRDGPRSPERPDEQVWVYVTPETHIADSQGKALTFGDLQPGLMVNVLGFRTPDGVQAREIVVEHPQQAVRFEGVITEIFADTTTFLLAPEHPSIYTGLRVEVTEQTVLLDEYGQPITFADLRVGDRVEGWGVWTQPVVSLRAETVIRKHGPRKVQLAGRITELLPQEQAFRMQALHCGDLGPDSWDEDSGEEMDDPEDEMGDQAGGLGNPGGEDADDDSGDHPFGARCVVRVRVSSSTQIVDDRGSQLSYADLQGGMLVGVAGTWVAGAMEPTVEAQQILVRTQPVPVTGVEVYGVIAGVDAENGRFTLQTRAGTITVQTDEQTVYEQQPGDQPIQFSDLQVGDFVEVEGIFLESFVEVVILARKVERYTAFPL